MIYLQQVAKSVEIINAQKQILAENLCQLEAENQNLNREINRIKNILGGYVSTPSDPIAAIAIEDTVDTVVAPEQKSVASPVLQKREADDLSAKPLPVIMVKHELPPKTAAKITPPDDFYRVWGKWVYDQLENSTAADPDSPVPLKTAKISCQDLAARYHLASKKIVIATSAISNVREYFDNLIASLYLIYFTAESLGQICDQEVDEDSRIGILREVARLDLQAFLVSQFPLNNPLDAHLYDQSAMRDLILDYANQRMLSSDQKPQFGINHLCEDLLSPKLYRYYANKNAVDDQALTGYRPASCLSLFIRWIIAEQLESLVADGQLITSKGMGRSRRFKVNPLVKQTEASKTWNSKFKKKTQAHSEGYVVKQGDSYAVIIDREHWKDLAAKVYQAASTSKAVFKDTLNPFSAKIPADILVHHLKILDNGTQKNTIPFCGAKRLFSRKISDLYAVHLDLEFCERVCGKRISGSDHYNLVSAIAEYDFIEFVESNLIWGDRLFSSYLDETDPPNLDALLVEYARRKSLTRPRDRSPSFTTHEFCLDCLPQSIYKTSGDRISCLALFYKYLIVSRCRILWENDMFVAGGRVRAPNHFSLNLSINLEDKLKSLQLEDYSKLDLPNLNFY